MKILFLGGTGIISTACTQLALARGHDTALLNRSKHTAIAGARSLVADIADAAAVDSALGSEHWDAVVDFIAFDVAAIEQRLALFRGRTRQYVFISSASAYQKPLAHSPITESTPLANPFWDYSRHKIACEDRLLRAHREENFPVTLIRPSLTYGDTVVPLAINSWGEKSFTAIARLRAGRPLIIPGDGLTLWTITHNSDFAKGLVGLLGRDDTLGHAFHITSDEALTWNQIYQLTAEAAGVPGKYHLIDDTFPRSLAAPTFVHIASDFICACEPGMIGTLLGDKSNCALFDNTKIKHFVPDFTCTTRFREGIARTLRWFDADPARQIIDPEANAKWDGILAARARGLAAR